MRLTPKFFFGREYDAFKDEIVLMIIKNIETGPVKVFLELILFYTFLDAMVRSGSLFSLGMPVTQ